MLIKYELTKYILVGLTC